MLLESNATRSKWAAGGDAKVDKSTFLVLVCIRPRREELRFDVTWMAIHDVVSVLPWLQRHESTFNWKLGNLSLMAVNMSMTGPAQCQKRSASEGRR